MTVDLSALNCAIVGEAADALGAKIAPTTAKTTPHLTSFFMLLSFLPRSAVGVLVTVS